MNDIKKYDMPTLRAAVDEVDDALLDLLERRAALSRKIGEVKRRYGSPVACPEREREVLDRLTARNAEHGGVLTEGHVAALWEVIFFCSRSLQEEK